MKTNILEWFKSYFKNILPKISIENDDINVEFGMR